MYVIAVAVSWLLMAGKKGLSAADDKEIVKDTNLILFCLDARIWVEKDRLSL